ncbi:pyridine nucleotide-disulfide oxidoreductase [Streptomyces albospinus]|uniref:Pyridine nucleotide-disulfide oxidoreductase n=1 Tax=Streptomyces albospinus TaxID=285515 RepID=A0ABQ2UYR8_9ACTN|nr:FAD-dependent oxidoreductase [Streptomyces albospinus]GGU60753.1 pyridine nucleotide-disulfide oxidoreductase [Streptomyces albospinus]
MKSVTVIGASLAGLYAARALRSQGFDGRLTIVGDEHHRPYDRPPLSKDFLTGTTGQDQLALADAEETAELDAEWLLGTRATGLDAGSRAVRLDTGRTLTTDGVVLATGAIPRRLPGPGSPPSGTHTLRTLEDARALRRDLTGGGPARVVVIGGGFIGAEVASSCAALGHHVTVVEAAPLPLVPQLGRDMAELCSRLHADHGVTLLTGTGVTQLHSAGVDDRVTAVELADGRLLPADAVVVGIGVRPATDWLADSGLPLDNGVRCDAGCATPIPSVVAVGDVANVNGTRAEHWTSATEQAATAARNLLAGRSVATHQGLPYFWSDQYGVRIQFAGRRLPGATPRILEGSPDDRSFLAGYERDGRTTAVLALNRPRPFMRLRRELARAAQPATT